MVLSTQLNDRSPTHLSSIPGPAHLPKHSDYSPLPAFHCTDTDDSGSDSDGDAECFRLPTFHDEAESDSDDGSHSHRRRDSLTVSTSPSPSHSLRFASPHAAICFSPTTFFASPSFASLLSVRAACLALSSPTAGCQSPPWTGSPHSASSALPSYSPHSSCVQPRHFAWQLEEAAVLFWERKQALTTADVPFVHSAADSGVSHGGAAHTARFICHTRHQTL